MLLIYKIISFDSIPQKDFASYKKFLTLHIKKAC